MDPYLSLLTRKYPTIKPPPRRDLEQYAIDVSGVYNRSRYIASLVRGAGLVIGDDDLVTLFLAGDGFSLTLLEKDERVLDVIRGNLPDAAAVELLPTDLHSVYQGTWPKLDRSYDFFVTSPPYTPEGLKIFSAVGIQNLKVGGLGFIASPYDADEKADAVSHELMRFVLENGCILERVTPAMTFEEGLGAYQIVVRKLRDTAAINWLRPLEGKMYEWEAFGQQDAYKHQSV
ncbi:MAG TPA: bis-aminopropyl spermidine synthase family protein [Polyangiaceae bacterium]|nr:bis-aminopropyl spermidine synthase family protein [Polyangiaceae bacterium]